MSLIKKIFNPNKYISEYRPIGMVSLLSIFSILLWLGIVVKTGSSKYYYLLWNLFLAWVPMFFAYLLYHRIHFPTIGLRPWKFWSMAGMWLAFLPNSPYLITDLIHINERHAPAHWGDPLLFFSFALSGLMAGIVSLYIMQLNFKEIAGKSWSWVITYACILLSGFGIFLGRIQRWNSWDIITNPHALLIDLFAHFDNPMAFYFTLGFSSLIGMVYFIMIPLFKPGKID